MLFLFGLLCIFLTGGVTGQQQCSPEGQLTPNYNDNTCQSYNQCYQGYLYSSSCPSGQVFYPGLNQCVLQSSYDCVCNAPSCTRPDCSGSQNTDIADKTNCSRFIYCNGPYPLRRDCPAGSLFNPEQRGCESRSSTRYVCPSDPFVCPQANGRFADLRDPNCQTYYDCYNYQTTKYVCDSNFHYYAMMDRCVLPDSYDCHDPNPFQCANPNVDVADPKDRTKYYYCNGYAPLRRSCPAGQYFNGDPNVLRCVN